MAVKKAEISAEEPTEHVVQRLLATGQFASESDVIRQGVLLLDQREANLNEIDRLLDEGLRDIEEGRVIDADIVFAELHNRYSRD